MGFKSFIGRAIGGFGSVIKKVGDFGSNVARKIGEFAPGIANIGGSIADMIGQNGIGDAIRSGGVAVSKFAPQVESILGKVGSAGQTMKGIGNLIR